MSSNFIKNAKTETASSQSLETYNHLSQIKPKKKRRQRRPIIDHHKSVEKIPLKTVKEYPDNVVLSKFLETNLGGSIVGEKKYKSTEALSIDTFEPTYSMEDKYMIAFNESKPSLRIFAKVSRKIARHHLATMGNINCIRSFASKIIGAKPKADRGKKCDSINGVYAIIGIRPDWLTSEIGACMFKNMCFQT